ncbi:cytochrome P450 [Aureobasidium pullulans EXF-150]|uniref:Cytochrome P450 n=1 Tax=Aureobasidium pullulans EXF-150 TaxID=1043002 RepID=A0A074YJY7_AURPU|nr:cytochrome P450 [Aureobasidium pullulans EXF-150]KEQ87191.1 cytochrome P450 [Aureobasidium pullulans EXF-150]
MPPKLPILISSAVASILLAHFAPGYGSRTQTFFLVAFTEFIAWATWRVVIYPNFLSPLKGLPEPSGGSWWNGHASTIMAQPSGHPMREWIDAIPNDGLIRYTNWFNSERVLLTNPKTLAEVLSSKNYEFIKPAHFLDIIGRILGIGLLFAEGDEHRTQRKNLMPAFSYRHIKDLYPVFWSKSKEMVERMSDAMHEGSETGNTSKESIAEGTNSSNVVEVSDWTSRATLDIIGVAGMGRDFEALKNPDNELNQTYKTIFHPPKSARYLQVAGMFLPRWFLKSLPIKRNDEISEGSALIKQTCRDLIAAKKIRMEKGAADETDILSVALRSGSFADENLVSQMMTFLAAGHETTSSSMQWAIYMMCRHPDVQKRVREEIHAKLPSVREPQAQITAADIDNCHYLQAVCKETLRLWAPVALTMRVAARDETINNHPIPKGTLVVVAPLAINCSKHLWGDDAMEFKPERWLTEGISNKNGGAESNYSFLTFLHGPRSCIGQGFANAEFACLLAAWIGKFDTEFEDPEYVLEVKSGITSRPKNGLRVKLTEVEGW